MSIIGLFIEIFQFIVGLLIVFGLMYILIQTHNYFSASNIPIIIPNAQPSVPTSTTQPMVK